MKPVVDLKFTSKTPYKVRQDIIKGEVSNEYRQARFFSGNRSFTIIHLSKMRKSLSGKPQNKNFYMFGSIFMHGFCPNNLPGKFARYRNMFKSTAYALDASTIDLCLSVFPWPQFRKTKAAIKLHTHLDLHGNIPTFIHITDGKVHDVNVLDILVTVPGSFYVMDRGYLDFARLYAMNLNNAYFVIRSKSNTKFRRVYSHPVEKDSGLICDQTIRLSGFYTSKDYPKNFDQSSISIQKPAKHSFL